MTRQECLQKQDKAPPNRHSAAASQRRGGEGGKPSSDMVVLQNAGQW